MFSATASCNKEARVPPAARRQASLLLGLLPLAARLYGGSRGGYSGSRGGGGYDRGGGTPDSRW
jgi:hypothetical protein